MDKLNITEGLWKLTDNFEITVDDVDPQEMSSEEIEANAKAIVTAVNNTYKKGINPEAVPEMHGALLEANKVLSKMNYNPDAKKINRLHHGIKLALKKAEL